VPAQNEIKQGYTEVLPGGGFRKQLFGDSGEGHQLINPSSPIRLRRPHHRV